MSFDMMTVGITAVYVLILQPFALLQILLFRRFLTRVQKRYILIFWCLLIVLEVGLVTAIVSLDVFPSRQIAYWLLGYLVWIPQFALAFCFTRRFWAGHIFIAAFRILFSGIIYTVTRAILLNLYPDRPLPSLYFEQILLYSALSLMAFPFLLRFFTNIFRHFEVASTRRYWRIITLIPVLLAAESLYRAFSIPRRKSLTCCCRASCCSSSSSCSWPAFAAVSARSTASCRYSKKNTSCSSSSCQRRIM